MPDEQQPPKRREYFRFPGWSEMSDAEKDTWAEQATDALIAAPGRDAVRTRQSAAETRETR